MDAERPETGGGRYDKLNKIPKPPDETAIALEAAADYLVGLKERNAILAELGDRDTAGENVAIALASARAEYKRYTLPLRTDPKFVTAVEEARLQQQRTEREGRKNAHAAERTPELPPVCLSSQIKLEELPDKKAIITVYPQKVATDSLTPDVTPIEIIEVNRRTAMLISALKGAKPGEEMTKMQLISGGFYIGEVLNIPPEKQFSNDLSNANFQLRGKRLVIVNTSLKSGTKGGLRGPGTYYLGLKP